MPPLRFNSTFNVKINIFREITARSFRFPSLQCINLDSSSGLEFHEFQNSLKTLIKVHSPKMGNWTSRVFYPDPPNPICWPESVQLHDTTRYDEKSKARMVHLSNFGSMTSIRDFIVIRFSTIIRMMRAIGSKQEKTTLKTSEK